MDGILAFATLFLGLVTGPQDIELLVGPEVAVVELRLDGEPIGELRQEPWKLLHDFGEWPEPHRLEAIAVDDRGREMARIEQWVNLPRPAAEAQIVLIEDDDGARRARLAWDTVESEELERLLVTFDELELEVSDPEAISLPPHDPEDFHLLRAELTFPSGLFVTTQATFGGVFLDRVETRLTSVPVRLNARRLPAIDQLSGAIFVRDKPARIVAAEKGPVDLVVVRDRSAHAHFQQMLGREVSSLRRHNKTLSGMTTAQRARRQMTPSSATRMQFVWPFEVEDEKEAGRRLFARSPEIDMQEGGVLWLLSQMRQPPFPTEEQKLADACGIAGRRAIARDRRRAVVLVLGDQPTDSSKWRPEHTRHYLESIRVPFFVWATDPDSPAARLWGQISDVSTISRLRRAYQELDDVLEAERIVWVEGHHLPAEIAVSGRDLSELIAVGSQR